MSNAIQIAEKTHTPVHPESTYQRLAPVYFGYDSRLDLYIAADAMSGSSAKITDVPLFLPPSLSREWGRGGRKPKAADSPRRGEFMKSERNIPAYSAQCHKQSSVRGVLQRKCSCGGSMAPSGECLDCNKKRKLQTKLMVNEPGDKYEVEADRVAASVLRMSDADVDLREGGAKYIQRKGNGETAFSAPPIVEEVLRTPGQPLDTSTRAFMDPRFGHDFGEVRVHTDARAAESARTVNAMAYTVGRDVVFGIGQYASKTELGKRLLAHELTHVIQQGSGHAHETTGNEGHTEAIIPSRHLSDFVMPQKKESENSLDSTKDHVSPGVLQRQAAPVANPVPPVATCPVTAIASFGPPDAAPAGALTAATQTALTCLQNAVIAAGGTIVVTTTFRSQAYQDHLVEVWDKVNAPARTEPECAAVMQNYATERATHFPMGAPARGVSNHTRGTAFDATVTLPAGTSLDTIQAGCNLSRPVAGEPWHFET